MVRFAESDDGRTMAKKQSTLRRKYLYRAVFTKDPMGFAGPDSEGKGFGHTLAIHKAKWSGSPYCVANEFIAAEIGHFLRLPIPPSGITYGDGGLVLFSTLDFNFDKLQLPHIVPDLCWAALPELCTWVVLFDIFIVNSDRHDENLAVDIVARPTAMRVFDHDQAILGGGDPAIAGIERLRKLTNRLGVTAGTVSRGNPHCLLDQVDTDKHFESWIGRIEAIPDWFLSEVCSEARVCGLTKTEVTAVRDFLVSRRNGSREILNSHRDTFTGIVNWTNRGQLLP